MQFNSYIFIFAFLPIVLLAYYASNRIRPIWGKIVILVASLFFYSFGQIKMLNVLIISVVVNYLSAILISRTKELKNWMLAIPVITNVGLLLYFKYYNFIAGSIWELFGQNYVMRDILLPVGISFYTFQQIAYIVSLYQGKIENRNVLDYLCYILFFPKLLMGPLMEPSDFMKQINDVTRKSIKLENVAIGIKMFSFGLLKKVLLADTFAKAVTVIYENIEAATTGECIFLLMAYLFQLYFDFSGYTDMAVGIAYMFNIDLPVNFNSPYKAISIRDFWKRWHISLTSFLTKYIYFPLGGSKKGALRTYINIIVVFTISGIWHGAGFRYIVWGVLNGIMSCFDRIFDKYEKKVFEPVRWFCTFVLVGILCLLVSSASVSEWKLILSKLFIVQDMTIGASVLDAFRIPEAMFIIRLFHLQKVYYVMPVFDMLAFVIAAFCICLIPENNHKNMRKMNMTNMIFAAVCFVWGVICLGAESSFVYFGF